MVDWKDFWKVALRAEKLVPSKAGEKAGEMVVLMAALSEHAKAVQKASWKVALMVGL